MTNKNIPDIQLPPSEVYTFVIEGTDTRLEYARNKDNIYLQILRDDNVQTVKKKLLMELSRVYDTDVAYEEIFMNAYVVSTPDAAQLFRDSLSAAHTTLSREEIMALCKKYVSETPTEDKDQYTLSEFVSFFKPTRKLVAIGVKYAESKHPFFIPDPLEPNNLTDKNIEMVFSETQLFFQYGVLADNVIHVTIAQYAISKSDRSQHDRIFRTFYRSLQYKNQIATAEDLDKKHPELVEKTKAALTDETAAVFDSVQMFHDIYNSRTQELSWISRGISSISFSIKSASFPLDSIFKSVHSSSLIPVIKYTPGNRREPIYRIYSERVSPNGQKIPYLNVKHLTKLSREMGRVGQVSLYIKSKRTDISILIHFDRSGKIIVDCEFTGEKIEADATSAIAEELNPILLAVGKDIPGLKLPEFVSILDVDVLTMKYIMKCKITNTLKFNIPCLNTILFDEKSGRDAGTTFLYTRVDNYKEMDTQNRFIHSNRNNHGLVGNFMEKFGINDRDEAKRRIQAFNDENVDIRGKVLANPGFSVDIPKPTTEPVVVITVDKITSVKYIEFLDLYFDSILRISQNPTSTLINESYMKTVCNAKIARDNYYVVPEAQPVKNATKTFMGHIEIDDDDDDEDEHKYEGDEHEYEHEYEGDKTEYEHEDEDEYEGDKTEYEHEDEDDKNENENEGKDEHEDDKNENENENEGKDDENEHEDEGKDDENEHDGEGVKSESLDDGEGGVKSESLDDGEGGVKSESLDDGEGGVKSESLDDEDEGVKSESLDDEDEGVKSESLDDGEGGVKSESLDDGEEDDSTNELSNEVVESDPFSSNEEVQSDSSSSIKPTAFPKVQIPTESSSSSSIVKPTGFPKVQIPTESSSSSSSSVSPSIVKPTAFPKVQIPTESSSSSSSSSVSPSIVKPTAFPKVQIPTESSSSSSSVSPSIVKPTAFPKVQIPTESSSSSSSVQSESSHSITAFPKIQIPTESESSSTEVCLLFLTYGDIMHTDKLKQLGYFDESNFHIHIHPKNKEQVSNEFKKHIIGTLVETKWADISIIKATVELVKDALAKNPLAKWFVLLSEDVYPLMTGSEFISSLDTSPKSKFNLRAKSVGYVKINGIETPETVYKTSQWCVLNVEDAERFVKMSEQLSMELKQISGAVDENFILTAITLAGTKDYENKIIVYDEWLKTTGSFHPTTFNSPVISSDFNEMKEVGAAFLRKTTKKFTDAIYIPKPVLNIAIIGTKTNQSELISRIDANSDLIFIQIVHKKDSIMEKTLSRAIKYYNCHWQNAQTAMVELHNKYSSVWSKIKLLDEKCNPMKLPEQIAECKLKYIHITKTGGTSVEESAHSDKKCEWGRYDPDIYAATRNLWSDANFSYWHTPPQYFHADKLQNMISKHDLFTTVRNPFTRVISEYYCKFGGPETKSKNINDFNDWILNKLKRVQHDINSGVLLSGHWIPQYYYFTDSNGTEIIPSSRRIKLESINSDLPVLLNKYGIQLNLARENETASKQFGVANLSREVINLILQIYEKDFSLLDYPTDNQRQRGGANDDYQVDYTGTSIRSFFLDRLKKRDSELFETKNTPGFVSYSKRCQPVDKHPVILTDEEKEKIDREYPGSYGKAMKYGTDEDHQFWYICPRYWCFKTNSSITEEDVKANKCGKIIDKEKKIGDNNAYVYEFKDKGEHIDLKGNYIQHNPGFNKQRDYEEFARPCCLKLGSEQEPKNNPKKKVNNTKNNLNTETEIHNQMYILDSRSLQNGRWGYLPNVAQMFLGIDYTNVSVPGKKLIIPGQSVFLRYGVNGQTFLGVFADIYASIKETAIPSVSEFRELLANDITLDMFVGIHNASLPQVFRDNNFKGKIDVDKYKDTEFYKRLIGEDRLLFFQDAVVAYENFQKYLRDTNNTNEIDYTYLWDVFCEKLGLNLILLEIIDSSPQTQIELVCPTNAHSSNSFDPKKQSVFILKLFDNQRELYQPIYLYKTDGKEITAQRTFSSKSVQPNVIKLLNMIGKIRGKYCEPLTSLPTVYKFKTPVSAQKLVELLKSNAKTAVLNYRNKVVGIHNGKVVIPCYPSSLHGLGLPTKQMDELELFSDYETTRDELNRVNMAHPEINCFPAFKFVDDKLVVGMLTKTNQFVQINPPVEVLNDGIEVMENPNWNDQDMAVVKGPDMVRVKMIKRISLESQFYSMFQVVARELLNDPIRADKRDRIIRISSDENTMDYKTKLKEVERVLREVMTPRVEFAEMQDDVLMELDVINECNASSDETPYCVVQDDGTQKTLFPSKHLLSGLDNDVVYYGRLADQLVRYSRVKPYVIYPENSINSRTTDYNLGDNEMLLVHSDITSDFFEHIDSRVITPYAKNTAYDFAQPSITQYYPNEAVKFDEQYNLADVGEKQISECVEPQLISVVGNIRSMWVKSFPKNTFERVFLNSSPDCTLHLMIHILQDFTKKPINVSGIRTLLWNAYSKYLQKYAGKIIDVLRLQRKTKMMDNVSSGNTTMQDLINSDKYYLTDLDVWMMATTYKIPIVLFTGTHLKGFKNNKPMWLRTYAAPPRSKFYFVRSGTIIENNMLGKYHLVIPPTKDIPMELTGLGEFSDELKRAESGDAQFANCVIGLVEFLQS